MQEKKITTYAFLHFESTGIDEQKPRATEFCIAAVNREHFLKAKSYREPQIVNKLRLHLHSRNALISHNTDKPTPDLLSNHSQIEDFVELLLLFLKRLPQPVCLLSHSAFDFRLLQAEIKSASRNLADDILYADTYCAFKSILGDVIKSQPLNNNKPLKRQVIATSSTLGGLNRSDICPCDESDDSHSSVSNKGDSIRGNVIVKAKITEEDEIEVIAINDEKAERDAIYNNDIIKNEYYTIKKKNAAKQNGDKEVSYPVIDLTEDSSLDGSNDETSEKSDDSNIIIENEDEKTKDDSEEAKTNGVDVDISTPGSSKKRCFENVETEAALEPEVKKTKTEDEVIDEATPENPNTLKNNTSDVKENTTNEESSSNKCESTSNETSYSLAALHMTLLRRSFEEKNQSSESNVNALLRVCHIGGEKFCEWVDKEAISVSVIETLW